MIILSGFLFFQKNAKGELALAYENYAGRILIVILIEILIDYHLFYYVLAGNNESFSVTPSTSNV